MDYAKAKKEVQTHKRRENYLIINLSYDMKLVLPHREGLAMIEALGAAEMLREPYNEPHRISGVDNDRLRYTTMSAEEYDRYKIAALLNVTIDEVRALEFSMNSPLPVPP